MQRGTTQSGPWPLPSETFAQKRLLSARLEQIKGVGEAEKSAGSTVKDLAPCFILNVGRKERMKSGPVVSFVCRVVHTARARVRARGEN